MFIHEITSHNTYCEGESRDSGDRLPTRNKTSMPKAIWGNANVGWIHNPSINVVGGIYGIRIVFI